MSGEVAARGICPVCAEDRAVRKDGRLYVHPVNVGPYHPILDKYTADLSDLDGNCIGSKERPVES